MTAPHRSDALLSLIGNTPLIPLRFESEGLTIFAKAEFLDPSGSVKDRLARSIILDAEERGYRVRIVMSTTASIERRTLLRRLGGGAGALRKPVPTGNSAPRPKSSRSCATARNATSAPRCLATDYRRNVMRPLVVS